MTVRLRDTTNDSVGQRDLALVAVTVVGLSRLVEPPLVWLVAALLLVAVVLGALQVLADEPGPSETGGGVAIEALILPAVVSVACVGAIRLVPFGLGLVPALGVTWLLVRRAVALEARLHRAASVLTADDQTAVLVTILVVSFIGFSGVAAMVPGALIDRPDGHGTLPETNLLILAIGDGIVAGLLGYRAIALRVTRLSDALWSAGTYAAAIAIGAAALRAMEIPRLVGPALLTLAVYLWDALSGATPARRRELRWLWQIGLLAALGVVVTAWNLALRS
jgi:hypothetical protein